MPFQYNITPVDSGDHQNFTLPQAPDPASSLQLFLNGQLSNGEYVLTGNAIAFTDPIAGTFNLQAFYVYGAAPVIGTGYTTVPQVSAMLPTFVRGNAQQAPADDQIQIWVNDIAGEIDAVLINRFTESINSSPSLGDFALWISLLPVQAITILEKINRYGAAAQLMLTLATIGSASTAKLALIMQEKFERMWHDLDASDDKGRPMASGMYDSYFDPLSRIETPRPGLMASSGAQIPCGQTPRDCGLNIPFSMNEVI